MDDALQNNGYCHEKLGSVGAAYIHDRQTKPLALRDHKKFCERIAPICVKSINLQVTWG